jgi:uncharacterized iron-regulated membrane protein
MRRVVFWLHLATGVSVGVVVLIMSVTGVLLTYEKQIIRWADTRTYRAAPPGSDAPRLPIDRLTQAVSAANGGAAVTTVTVWADRSFPAAVAIGPRPVYVNPYTGVVLGEGSDRTRAFFRRMTDWHRWLGAAAGPGRVTARAITGACNMAFLFLVVSGLYLWLPKIWTWRQVRNITWFKGGLRAKARDFNWHNVIGFWSAVPLAIVVFSGAVISYPWMSNLVYRIAGEAPPLPPQRAAGAGVGGRGEAPGGGGGAVPAGSGRGAERAGRPEAPAGLDQLWTRAEGQVDGWKSILVRLPTFAGGPVVFTIDRGEAGQPQKRSTLTLNGATGEVIRWEPFSSLTRGRRLRSILRFAHTGEVLGLLGQTIAGVVSAGGAVLVYTGISLAIRRLWAAFAARRHRGSFGELSRSAPAYRRPRRRTWRRLRSAAGVVVGTYAADSTTSVSSSNPDRSPRSRHERPSSARPPRTDTIT